MFETVARIIIVISLAGAVIGGFLSEYRIYRNCHYRCVKCSTLYKPNSLWQSACAMNGPGQRKLPCPQCGKREWANMIKGDLQQTKDDAKFEKNIS